MHAAREACGAWLLEVWRSVLTVAVAVVLAHLTRERHRRRKR